MKLNKRDVETMLRAYDDDPVGALTTAMRKVLNAPDADWAQLLHASGLTAERRAALLAGEQTTLDNLLTQLNELRTLYN